MDHVKGMMDHSERAKHGTGDTGNGTYMAMPMVFTFSTKVTILFSWWSTIYPHGVDPHPRLDHSLRPHRKWNWSQDIIGSMLEGVRAFTGYALMLAVMTYNVGILCAVIMGILIGEVFLGHFSMPTPSSRWQDRVCHDG
ncbi:copper transporter crmD [Penicillium diatomitis]|uniref:Copper transport protein n=1 Tax=Penicillium diatomitis TaxID=2819901 RepID=A0A9W9XN12_9EURO|nr:copper transporter crmD [Penicillium diatomitis]KAJ5495500.1 copper transporter crmD [Penicillium diatomitis]